MRIYLTCIIIALLYGISSAAVAQRLKSITYSASSAWQQVTLRPAVRPATSVSASPARGTADRVVPNESPDFRPAFTGDFATNRNGWKAGAHGDYQYQIGQGRYSIRKRNVHTRQNAFSTVELPAAINLNQAEVFTIKVDMLADSGRVPAGGLLFGVKDSLNYNAFMLNEQGQVSIIRVANGQTFSDYMPGDYFSAGVLVDKNRDRLMIQRKGGALRFYINSQEIRSSPYAFKMLSGNGIGLTSSGYWTSFQKLSVTVGL